MMSYAVSRRRREIGIRMALGARPGTVERLIVRQGMVLASIALALGWPAAWMLSKVATSFLYGIQPHDAVTFAAAPLVLLAIANELLAAPFAQPPRPQAIVTRIAAMAARGAIRKTRNEMTG